MRKRIDWHRECLIPELLYFQNGGTFVGSVSNKGEKEYRYRLSPSGTPEEPKIKVEAWYGPFCYEKSEIPEQGEFPMDEDGRFGAIDWLRQKYESLIPDKP